MDKVYYVYVWMTDAPYYVGKGKGKRARNPKRNFGQMRPDTQIIFFRQNLNERAARRIEDLLVEKWGRKGIDPGGILENVRRPRDGWPHGDWMTDEVKKKCGKKNKGRTAWNKGLTKETDYRVAAYAASNVGKHKPNGKVAWNRGLTKDNDPRMAKASKSLQGRVAWNKGKFKK